MILEEGRNASDGFWAMYLLPIAIITSAIKYSISITPTYKLSSLLSIGLILTSNVIGYGKQHGQELRTLPVALLSIIVTLLFRICVHEDWLFALCSAIFCTVIYFKLFQIVMTKFQGCFTVGEAALISQGIIFFLYSTILNIINSFNGTLDLKSNLQISTLIIQFGLLGVGIIACIASTYKLTNPRVFYTWSCLVVLGIVFLPLHVILQRSPLLWILNIIQDVSNLKLMIYWSFCSLLGVLAVRYQILKARKASTGKRKIFHIIAVIVYIPGLLYGCSLIYLASGVTLGIFIALEILRLFQMPPMGIHLQDGFTVFSDEKDGWLSLTPVYLLTGCSLPLWIHPSPCDVTDSGQFNLIPLMSGLLIVGLGDTAASVVGSTLGKYKWPGSRKTIEGTIACVLIQIGFIHLLVNYGIIHGLSTEEHVKIWIAVIVSSIVEAKTTQVDNLVLPLVMYIILII